MKKLNIIPKTRKAGVITLAVVSGLVVGGLGVTRSEAAMDWLGLEQKLTNHDEQLANHDDRIANVEKDVDKVQENTQTAPSTEKVIVREVQTPNPTVTNAPEPADAPAPTLTPKPQPVKVTAFQVIPSGQEFNCKYTYSDGTSRTFRWKWYSTAQTSDGPVQAVNQNGYCDSQAIGLMKD